MYSGRTGIFFIVPLRAPRSAVPQNQITVPFERVFVSVTSSNLGFCGCCFTELVLGLHDFIPQAIHQQVIFSKFSHRHPTADP